MKNPASIEKHVYLMKDFCLVGMIGIIDSPREGISEVISKCRAAGIKVLMITGDYALTAVFIASEIGIFTRESFNTIEKVRLKSKNLKIAEKQNENHNKFNSLLLTGAEIDFIDDEDWRIVRKYEEIVLARTNPEQKLKAVKEFRKAGYIEAITGDGVNDAPALKNADIRILIN